MNEQIETPAEDQVEAATAPVAEPSDDEQTAPAAGAGESAPEVDEDDLDESVEAEAGGAPQGSKKRQALENEGEIAADYLEELLDIADLDGDIDTFVEAGRSRVSVLTDSDQLVGRDGEVLDALQELCRLAVMTQTGKRSRLMLDIAGHRDKRRSELEAMATDAVVEVKETGESVRLIAMNPFERKIVHDVVAKAGLSSESEGQEPNRRVVILPAQ